MTSWIYFWIATFKTKYKTSRKDYVIAMIINITIVSMVTLFLVNSVLSLITDVSNSEPDLYSVSDKVLQLYEIQPNVQNYIVDAYSGKAQSSQSFNQLLDKYGSEDTSTLITMAWLSGGNFQYDDPSDEMMAHNICAELNMRYNLIGKDEAIKSDLLRVLLRLKMNEQQTELNNIIEQAFSEKFVKTYNKAITSLKVLIGLLCLLVIPTITLTVRRLKDVGVKMGVIPVLILLLLPGGALVLLVLCLLPSNRLGNMAEQYYY